MLSLRSSNATLYRTSHQVFVGARGRPRCQHRARSTLLRAASQSAPAADAQAGSNDVNVFQLPTAQQESVEGVLQAMQQAEAAQQQLMTSGDLADAVAAGNQVLSEILFTHSMLQQLYHKSIRGYLQQYGQLAVSPAGARTHVCMDDANHSCGECSTHTLAAPTVELFWEHILERPLAVRVMNGKMLMQLTQ